MVFVRIRSTRTGLTSPANRFRASTAIRRVSGSVRAVRSGSYSSANTFQCFRLSAWYVPAASWPSILRENFSATERQPSRLDFFFPSGSNQPTNHGHLSPNLSMLPCVLEKPRLYFATLQSWAVWGGSTACRSNPPAWSRFPRQVPLFIRKTVENGIRDFGSLGDAVETQPALPSWPVVIGPVVP